MRPLVYRASARTGTVDQAGNRTTVIAFGWTFSNDTSRVLKLHLVLLCHRVPVPRTSGVPVGALRRPAIPLRQTT